MNKSATAMSLVMMTFGIVFLIFAFDGGLYVSSVIAISSLLLLLGGALVMINGRKIKSSLYVCGECNLTFLEELDLRKHYAIEHTKKDSDKK
jgi:membrane-bound ClpP family serine protease